MKNVLMIFFIFGAAMAAMGCGGSDSYPMCNCNEDEMCVEEECMKIPANFEPAPSDDDP